MKALPTRRANALVLALWCALLLTPLLVHLFRPPHEAPLENRTLAPAPGWPGTLDEVSTWPARMQCLDPNGPLAAGRELWLDGAHNPTAAETLADAMPYPMHVVLGILANKDVDAIVAALAPHALSLTFVPVADHEHHDQPRLRKVA